MTGAWGLLAKVGSLSFPLLKDPDVVEEKQLLPEAVPAH